MMKVVVCLTACAALAGCYQVPQSTAASYVKGSISAVPSQPAGGAVTVSKIEMPSNGWVVLHAVKDGVMDVSGSIGHAYVSAGPSENIAVPLSVAANPGEQVVAMLHLDTGNAKTFEFQNGNRENLDPPVMVDGKAVMAPIDLN